MTPAALIMVRRGFRMSGQFFWSTWDLMLILFLLDCLFEFGGLLRGQLVLLVLLAWDIPGPRGSFLAGSGYWPWMFSTSSSVFLSSSFHFLGFSRLPGSF